MADFIAYYGVSTDRQRAGELGLDAQRQAVAGFLSTGQLVAEFTESRAVASIPTDRSFSQLLRNAGRAAPYC